MNLSSLSPESIQKGLEGRGPFQQEWQVRLTDPVRQNALELRFSFLVSRNGFQRVAEVCAILFQREAGRETKTKVLKQNFDPASFGLLSNRGFKIGTCELSEGLTRGSIQAQGQTLEWDLSITSRQKVSFELIPPSLRKLKISGSAMSSIEADALISGRSAMNGTKLEWSQAPGMVERHEGPLTDHSWIWAHSNHFVSESGASAPFVFEGLTLRGHILGILPSPRFSSFHFLFKGQKYSFNSFRDAIRIKSHHTTNEWHFQAERDELMFRGHAQVEHKDLAGLTLEDIHGSLLYCSTSELADLSIHVYRRGKLEAALKSEKAAAMEIVSTKKNPYVPLQV
ncbi:MAG: hypothetical protein P4M08_05060 [Oligoflexia bacterium]|nr:hypothetical protein [Oligoflexia bacterium]